MNADEKRKVFEELLDEYQDVILSEFGYEDGGREAARRAWLNKYDGIKEPLIKDEKARKVFREWAEFFGAERFRVNHLHNSGRGKTTSIGGIDITTEPVIELPGHIGEESRIYSRSELCGEEEE